MNAFDTNFDAENEVYAVNTVAFHYTKHPIALKTGELTRVYLATSPTSHSARRRSAHSW
jgi:hypothetical protein